MKMTIEAYIPYALVLLINELMNRCKTEKDFRYVYERESWHKIFLEINFNSGFGGHHFWISDALAKRKVIIYFEEN